MALERLICKHNNFSYVSSIKILNKSFHLHKNHLKKNPLVDAKSRNTISNRYYNILGNVNYYKETIHSPFQYFYFTRYNSTSSESTVLSMTTENFSGYLKDKKIKRCYFVWNEKQQKVLGSHPELKEIEDWLNIHSNTHYKNHEAIFLALGMRSNCLLGAFLWNVNRGQAVSSLYFFKRKVYFF